MERAKQTLITMLRERKGRLRIAIQKDGRLFSLSWGILKACIESCGGTMPERETGDRRATIPVETLPGVSFVFLRNTEIPSYVAKGVADVGVAGEDQVLEQSAAVTVQARLGEARTTLQVMVAASSPITSLNDIQGKRVASPLTNITRRFLNAKGIHPAAIEYSKTVEAALVTEDADVGFDLVQTGTSMRINNLRSIANVQNFEALLITK